MTSTTAASVELVLAELFRTAGATARIHARDIDGDREVGLGADEPVVLASTFKVPVALEAFRQAAEGRLDLAQRIRVPVDGRAPGPTGISAMADEVEASLRDLVQSMIAVSDNAATDVVCELVGLDAVQARLQALGMDDIRVPHDCRGIFATMYEDAAAAGVPAEQLMTADASVLRRMRALSPAHTNCGTPRAMTALLAQIWRDEAAPAEACAQVRAVMAQQVWPHRLTAGFPSDVTLAGKTGTLPSLANEVGVVCYPDGKRYAVAVFGRSSTFSLRQPLLDRAIGAAARVAVDALRAEP